MTEQTVTVGEEAKDGAPGTVTRYGAARILDVSVTTITRLAKTGRLDHYMDSDGVMQIPVPQLATVKPRIYAKHPRREDKSDAKPAGGKRAARQVETPAQIQEQGMLEAEVVTAIEQGLNITEIVKRCQVTFAFVREVAQQMKLSVEGYEKMLARKEAEKQDRKDQLANDKRTREATFLAHQEKIATLKLKAAEAVAAAARAGVAPAAETRASRYEDPHPRGQPRQG